MLNILIGHRGVGKTYFLKQIKNYYKKKQIPAHFIDLDEEIEKASQKSLFELFTKGEVFFRKWEQKIFKKITHSLKDNEIYFLCVGAGCVLKKKPDWNIIYLFRESDRQGRFFLKKPPLSKTSSLKEWKKLYRKRSSYYLQQADSHLYRREYFKKLNFSDLIFLGLTQLKKEVFSYRLYPKLLPSNEKKWNSFFKARFKWGIRFFEVHDQDCSLNFVRKIQKYLPSDKILFSSQQSKKFQALKNKKYWSWDLSLGSPPKNTQIISLHKRNLKSLKFLLNQLSKYKDKHLKLAVEIYNLKELQLAYHWWKEDPKNRSFLPRSFDGKWLWFRQIFGPNMFLHFIKEHHLSFSKYKNQDVLDQPYLSEALPFLKKSRNFAGLLANPSKTLASPSEQRAFFLKNYSLPITALTFEEEEINQDNLTILKDLGFVFFAVSSPLKKKVFLHADQTDSLSKQFQSSNTLIFKSKKWKAFNTDWHGLKVLKKYNSPSTVVWGGGGIRPVLKKILPQAHFYSARTAQNLNLYKTYKTLTPKVLIWAVGRKRMQESCVWPSKHWKPSQIMDINYTEDSPGLEYALKIKAKYQNAWFCFKKQAERQRELFKKHYKKIL
ncbi:MAG: hypothetical protein GDA46_01680 [Bdellovibrionales bacterium]|nr:hypothetical protein [Bdellovibrionales bacterium]